MKLIRDNTPDLLRGTTHTVMRHLEELNNITQEQVINSSIDKMTRKGAFHGRFLLLHDPLSNKTNGS